MPAIVALIKNVPDTWSTKSLEPDFTLDRDHVDSVIDEVNEYAVEQALRLRDEAGADAGYRVIALTVGPAGADEALRKALAMGADDAIHVQDPALAGSDALATTWTISNALNTIEDVAIVLAGASSSDASSGSVPGMLAEYRQLPALTFVNKVTLDGQTLKAVREDGHGTYRLSAQLPAIVSVTDKADKPRFPNFKGLMAAKKHQITVLDLAAIGVAPGQVGLDSAATRVTAAADRPAREAGETVRGAGAAKAIAEFLTREKFV